MYQYFTETGATVSEAYEKIQRKYGSQAKVMDTRTVYKGGFLGLFQKESTEVVGYLKHDYLAGEKAKLEEEKKKILAQAAIASQSSQKEKEKIDAVREDETLKEVLQEVKSLKTQLHSLPRESGEKDHPTVSRLKTLFKKNDFSDAYQEYLLGLVRQTFSLEQLDDSLLVEDRVLEWMAESLKSYAPPAAGKPRVFVLVGPTGVGKTTTIAKLAAIFGGLTGQQEGGRVAMITIDNYRIGAKVQIEKYGEIMGFPVSGVESFEELKDRIGALKNFDHILIDTIGKSPRDFMKLAEMRSLLEAAGKNAEVHLALSATTKTQDFREIMAQFEPFQYKSVVITKMDETSQAGNILSVLWEKGKSVSFVTNGQGVPQDIRRADVRVFIETLSGFNEDSIKKQLGSKPVGKEGVK